MNNDHTDSMAANPILDRISTLPQELQDMILACATEPDSSPRHARIDRDFKTPIALRLCRRTRQACLQDYLSNTLFIFPLSSLFEWLNSLRGDHKSLIREVGISDVGFQKVYSCERRAEQDSYSLLRCFLIYGPTLVALFGNIKVRLSYKLVSQDCEEEMWSRARALSLRGRTRP